MKILAIMAMLILVVEVSVVVIASCEAHEYSYWWILWGVLNMAATGATLFVYFSTKAGDGK